VKLKLLAGVLLFLIVLNLATIGTFVYTQWKQEDTYRAPRVNRFPSSGIRRPGEMRALDPEKRRALRSLLGEFHEETRDLQDEIGRKEVEVFALLERETVPRDSLNMVLNQISDLRLEISRRATDKLIEAKIHLDPRQQRMFFRMILMSRTGHDNGMFDQRPDEPPRGRGRKERGDRI
jgi:uncharacterized membrane protein